MAGRPPVSERAPHQKPPVPGMKEVHPNSSLASRRPLLDAHSAGSNIEVKTPLELGDWARGKTDNKTPKGEYEEHEGVVVHKGDKKLRLTNPKFPYEGGTSRDGLSYDTREVDAATAQPAQIPEHKRYIIEDMQRQIKDIGTGTTS